MKDDLRLHEAGVLRDADEHHRVLQQTADDAFLPLPPLHCVNLDKIREIEPWFNNTYILRLRDRSFRCPSAAGKRVPAVNGALEIVAQRLAQVRARA